MYNLGTDKQITNKRISTIEDSFESTVLKLFLLILNDNCG